MAVERSPVSPVPGEVAEAHRGSFLQVSSLPTTDFSQCRVNVRQVRYRQVPHERARNLIRAHAPVQPAQEQNELHSYWDNSSE